MSIKNSNTRIQQIKHELIDICYIAFAGIALGMLILGVMSTAGITIAAGEGGSMEPTIEENALVIASDVDPNELSTIADDSDGDIAVFEVNGEHVAHTAVAKVEEGDVWTEDVAGVTANDTDMSPAPDSGFIMKGDGNDHYDNVVIKEDQIEAVIEHTIPHIGKVMHLLPG